WLATVLGDGLGQGEACGVVTGAAFGDREPVVGEVRRSERAPGARLHVRLLGCLDGAVLDGADQVVAPDLEPVGAGGERVPPRRGQLHPVGEGALPGARVLLRRRVEGGDVAAAGGALE